MKNIFYILLAALLIAATCAISFGEGTTVELISPERLLELAGLTENGLDIQDVADAIAQYGITEDMLGGRNQEEIAEAVQFCLDHLAKYDYGYLFEGETVSPENRTPRNILRMAAWTDNDVLHPTWMIDFEKGRCYYSGGFNFLKNIREADWTFDLTDEFSAAVQAIIEQGQWAEWEYTYTGDTSEYGTYWQLAIETPEGVSRYTIQGFGSQAPDGLHDISYEIFKLFWAMEQ